MNLPQVQYHSVKASSYQAIWDEQTRLHQELVSHKLEQRHLPEVKRRPQTHYLIFCEHNPVYTIGKTGSIDHLLLSDQELEEEAIEFFKINRGGDITYHGLGQITGYPIFDLDEFFTDVHRYVRTLEECIIELLQLYGIQGMREQGFTGVWIHSDDPTKPKRKICAIGVHLSRWVTMHGFALNVNTDLSYFDKIIPCGITDQDKTVTSLAQELGNTVDIDQVKEQLKHIFATQFKFEYVN